MSTAGTFRFGAAGLRRAAVGFAAALVVAGLASCVPAPAGETTPSSAPGPATQSAAPAVPEPDPELVQGGTAEDNQPYFDFVAGALVADGGQGGRPIVDGLVAAGFDKSAMQVTTDRTPLGNTVDSVQFSVEFDDGCLIGQASGSTYAGTLARPLESGGCLVGNTRTIDW